MGVRLGKATALDLQGCCKRRESSDRACRSTHRIPPEHKKPRAGKMRAPGSFGPRNATSFQKFRRRINDDTRPLPSRGCQIQESSNLSSRPNKSVHIPGGFWCMLMNETYIYKPINNIISIGNSIGMQTYLQVLRTEHLNILN